MLRTMLTLTLALAPHLVARAQEEVSAAVHSGEAAAASALNVLDGAKHQPAPVVHALLVSKQPIIVSTPWSLGAQQQPALCVYEATELGEQRPACFVEGLGNLVPKGWK